VHASSISPSRYFFAFLGFRVSRFCA
jgi:hypothetical protein